MLVISSNNQDVYKAHKRIWKTYMKSHPDIDCYFIEYTYSVIVPTLVNDTLYLRGTETMQNIIRKTLDAMAYFTSRTKYDYVVRANLSSVWIFSRLMQYLETAPRYGLYGGEINRNMPILHKVDYVSGAGIVFSSDVCQLLLQNRHIVYESNVIDDVDIGYALDKLQIKPTYIPRVNVYTMEDMKREGIQYRVRFNTDREREPHIMMAILSSVDQNN